MIYKADNAISTLIVQLPGINYFNLESYQNNKKCTRVYYPNKMMHEPTHFPFPRFLRTNIYISNKYVKHKISLSTDAHLMQQT